MARKKSKNQGKKGAPAPPGSGGPEDIQSKEDTSAQAEVCVTQPSSPSLPPANLPSPSLTKESESTSATEETSFASCLTEEASALSECCVLPTQDVTPASEASCAPVGAHQADPLSNSVSDSVAQNITQNGVKKDSEYESAEELESPSGSTAVVEEPASTSANIVTNQAQSAKPGPDTPVLTRDLNGVEDKDETRKTEVAEETGSHVIQGAVNGHTESDQKNLVNTISDSVVTVTKSEIIEESIQVLPEVKKTETVEHKSHQGENRIVTTETVATNGNLSEVHGRLSSTAENSHEESEVKEIICNGDKTCSEEVTDNQISCVQVTDEQNNSIPIEESTTETKNREPGEINSIALPLNTENPEEIPILPKKAYNLDFLDNLDDPNFNPFATKTSVRNTPPPSPEPGRKPLKPAIKKKKPENKRSEILKKENPPDEIKREQEQKTETTEETKPLNPSIEQEAVPVVTGGESEETNKEQALEIVFEDTPKVVSKPPRTLGKKTPLKPKVKAPVEKNNNTVVKSDIPEAEVKSEPEDLPIPPSKGYNLDFLDNLDDPNFNPFQTKTTVSNSPPKEGFVVSDKSEQDNKPKPKVVSPKKSPAKKGFSVVKNKSKTEKSHVKPVDEVDLGKQTETSVTNHTANQSETETQEDTVVVPKKGYNLDFLDDPNFDPFQTRSPVEITAPEDSKPITPVNSSEVVQKKPSPTEVKPAEEVIESESHKEERLGAEGSEEPSVSVSNEVQNKQEEKEEREEKQAEEQESVRESQSLKVSSSQLLEEKPNPVSEQAEVSAEVPIVEEKTEVSDVKPQVAVVKPQVAEVQPLVQDLPVEKETDSQKEESLRPDSTLCQKSDTTVEQTEKVTGESQNSEESVPVRNQEETESDCTGFPEGGLPKVPSIGRIGQLDSLEFAQLLGNEASRLAEEFMNCSCDSGLPDSDDSSSVKCISSTSNMDHSSKAAHLDENVNPFLKNSRLARSPPLGKRGAVCGAESGDNSDAMDTFKPRRSLRREEVLGEDRQDTSSVDEDSGIVMPTRADLEAEVNHSEAGPEIATGLTSSDLRCASQCLSSSASSASLRTEDPEEDLCDQITDEEFLASEAFFKEASEMERQFRRNLSTPMGSQSKLSGDEVTPIKEKPEHPSVTPESPQNKPVPSTSTPIPPREERSAPEGTSSPTPRPSDTSEHKPSSSRPLSVPADGYVTTAEVEELLKRQSLQFEEKLLRAELAAGEKERKLIQAMKEEQKDKGSVAELAQSRDALLKMVGQYKGMLAQLVGEKEKEKQGAEERIKALEVERNQALDDLANVENAFSDVHRKYERTKQVVDTLRRNEETLRGAIADYESKLQKQEQKFVEFQKHAEEKIQLANEEFETMRKANEQEMTKMAALLKKAEMKIVSLQDAFDRKTRENQELTQLCDDLINKVGGTN